MYRRQADPAAGPPHGLMDASRVTEIRHPGQDCDDHGGLVWRTLVPRGCGIRALPAASDPAVSADRTGQTPTTALARAVICAKPLA